MVVSELDQESPIPEWSFRLGIIVYGIDQGLLLKKKSHERSGQKLEGWVKRWRTIQSRAGWHAIKPKMGDNIREIEKVMEDTNSEIIGNSLSMNSQRSKTGYQKSYGGGSVDYS